MKIQNLLPASSSGFRSPHRALTTAFAATALSVAATAQTGHEGHSHGPTGPTRMVVTADSSGVPVAFDRQTGKARSLTAAEAQLLANGLKTIINRSTDGLTVVRRADGSYSIDLQGRFHSVMLAKREDNGTVTMACVDSPEQAAAFFDIDPRLLGVASTSVPTAPTPALEVR